MEQAILEQEYKGNTFKDEKYTFTSYLAMVFAPVGAFFPHTYISGIPWLR